MKNSVSLPVTSTNNRSKKLRTKIIIIGTYFGKWPVWFPAFLLSCAKNETIDWLFFTDCEIPQVTYHNIQFQQMDLEQLRELAGEKLKFRIQKGFYSQVDLQPVYGLIFEEFIEGFEFWGHCDIDVIWGDIRKFFTEDILGKFDIISPRQDFLAGHLTLWRNIPEINTLFRAVPAYRGILSSREYLGFDECIISTYVKKLIAQDDNIVRVFWPKRLVMSFYRETNLNGWYWDRGRVFDSRKNEYIYLHFQHYKKDIDHIDFQIGDNPRRFEFSEHRIWSHQSSIQYRIRERLERIDLKTSTGMISRRSMTSLRLLKKVLLVKDLYWARRLMINSINASDVQYNPKTGRIFLSDLEIFVEKGRDFLLDGYHWAVQLAKQGKAKFRWNENDELVVDVKDLHAYIESVEEIRVLKELLVDGTYNFLFSRPTVVLDIGMSVGLTSICFASQPDVVVVGYEPYEGQYRRALRNIDLNPHLANKIQPRKVGVSDTNFKSIAMFYPTKAEKDRLSFKQGDDGMGPNFIHEEVEIEDAAEVLDAVAVNYPGRDIVVKIYLDNVEYHINGVTEYQIINKFYETGKLNLIDGMMVMWRRSKFGHSPDVIARQLSDDGYEIFLFTPNDPHRGMLYAVRRGRKKAIDQSVVYDSARTV